MRAALAAGVGAAIGGSTPQIVRAADVTPATPGKRRVLRVAHLTDMHVTHQDDSEKGFAQALRSLDQHQPDLILTGGDHVMDASGQHKQQAVAWYDEYERVLAANTKLPVYPCIGNHDVYGWTTKAADPADPDFGKAMALDRLKMKSRYYSFDRAGWHFVILDNVMRREPLYYGNLDPEQQEWLRADLAASPLPKVVMTHIPLLAVCSIFDGGRDTDAPNHSLTDANMHHNVRPLLKLLAAHNVKLCLSGHLHQVDHVEYLGITFCCNGAVCGSWWHGPHLEFPEGYGLVDLYADGTVENRYVTYGWKAPQRA
jgi:3',5'-cyclic AMP phosphodiesterase CpdA